MSKEIFLELGDIIKMNAPGNHIINNKTFYVDYLDDTLMRLLDIKTFDSHRINIAPDGSLRDESIISIEILSKTEQKGYARLNNLVVGAWVEIHIRGEMPFIITGEITNVDEDMIEIQEYKSHDKLYIDFGYKGLPLDIPGLQIKIRPKPTGTTPDHSVSKTGEEEEDVVEEEEYAHDILSEEKLEDILGDAEEEEEEIEIEQIVIVPEEKRRYDINIQMANMLDERLSIIPNKNRTKEVINELHTELERFKQLRLKFSILDEYGIPGKPLHRGQAYRPLGEELYKMEKCVHWIIPIVKNNKKLYDIEFEEEGEDSIFLRTEDILTAENEIYRQFDENICDGEKNKYEALLQKLNPHYTPFQSTDDDDILITKYVDDNYDVIVNNSGNFETTVIAHQLPPSRVSMSKSKESSNRIFDKQYYMDRYNVGLTHLMIHNIRNYEELSRRMPLTHNDSIDITGFLICPRAIMNYSRIYLPKTSIMKRCDLHNISFNYSNLFHSAIVTTLYPIIDDAPDSIDRIDSNFKYGKDTFLEQFIELTVNTTTFDEVDDDGKKSRFENFTNAIIPTTNKIFELMKNHIKGSVSFIDIIDFLEPFSIHYESIVYKQYVPIIRFIKKNITILKKLYRINAKASIAYSKKQSKKQKKSGFVTEIDDSILKLYNIDSVRFDDILQHMIKIDNARFLFTKLSFEDIDLHSATDMEALAQDSLESIEANVGTNKENNQCKNYVLAKVYMDMGQLADDDDRIDIYFDRKYDTTQYSILDEFTEQREHLEDEAFQAFLKTHLEMNMTSEDAEKEAVAIIEGKRKIGEGDYAIVEEDDISYYRRTNNIWVKDELIEGNALDETFCNLQKKCLKLRESCGDEQLNKSLINKDLLQQISHQFETAYSISKDELVEKLTKQKHLYEKKMKKLQMLQHEELIKYDKQKLDLIEEVFGERYQSTLQTRLRDIILAQSDFVKKQTTIIKFVSIYCKREKAFPHWFLCKENDMKLLPTFYKDLADAYVRKNYIEKLNEIKQTRGTISDGGDKWVDIHSGYIICDIDYDTEEGYTEEGFKQVSRDVMEKSLGDELVKKTIVKKFASDEERKIYNIVMAMSEFIGINMEYNYISSQVLLHLANLPNKREYTVEIKRLKKQKKTKKFPKYETFQDINLLLYTLGYFLIMLQTNIPSFMTMVRYPGCKKSFGGYPFDGSEDYSTLKYIACIVQKVSKKIDVWRVLSKTSLSVIEKKLKKKIDEIIRTNESIGERIQKKAEHLEMTPDKEKIPYSHDIKKWNTFLPPLHSIEITKQRNLGRSFKSTLLKLIENGDVSQFNQISILLGKIIYFALSIQTIIQTILEEQDALLTNAAGIPFLENNCCNDGNKNTYLFLISENDQIETNNREIQQLSDLYAYIQNLSKGYIFYDDEDTHAEYPQLEYNFDEETIFRAFISYCKLDIIVPAHSSLQTICIDKLLDVSTRDSFEEKMMKLKERGTNLTEKALSNLLTIVGRENYIDIDITRPIVGQREQLQQLLERMKSNNGEEFQTFIAGLLEVNDTYHSLNNRDGYVEGPVQQLRNFISRKSIEKREHIGSFFDFFACNFEEKKSINISNFLQNITDWKLRGEGIYMERVDETHLYVGDFLKNCSMCICDIYPLIIKNKVEYSARIPKQWGLSSRHESKIRAHITGEFADFKSFYRDEELTAFLCSIKEETADLRILMRYIPFLASFGGADSIFDGQIYEEIMEYIFLLILNKYTASGHRLIMRRTSGGGDGDDNDKQTLNEKICRLLLVYFNLIRVKKDKLNRNNEDIAEKILKQKEREKDKILRRGALLSMEESKSDSELKRLKLGVWGKGLEKSLFKYSADEWDIENAEIERDAELANRLDGSSVASHGTLEIEFGERDYINDRLHAENYSISHIPSSEDGDNEQNF